MWGMRKVRIHALGYDGGSGGGPENSMTCVRYLRAGACGWSVDMRYLRLGRLRRAPPRAAICYVRGAGGGLEHAQKTVDLQETKNVTTSSGPVGHSDMDSGTVHLGSATLVGIGMKRACSPGFTETRRISCGYLETF